MSVSLAAVRPKKLIPVVASHQMLFLDIPPMIRDRELPLLGGMARQVIAKRDPDQRVDRNALFIGDLGDTPLQVIRESQCHSHFQALWYQLDTDTIPNIGMWYQSGAQGCEDDPMHLYDSNNIFAGSVKYGTNFTCNWHVKPPGAGSDRRCAPVAAGPGHPREQPKTSSRGIENPAKASEAFTETQATSTAAGSSGAREARPTAATTRADPAGALPPRPQRSQEADQ